MKEIKTTMNTRVRAEYEPVSVRVLKVTPQGVLCQSGGGGFKGMLGSMSRTGGSW